MDLRKAYETLGLVRGASPQEVEDAYRRLRDDLDTRLARVSVGAVATRFRDVLARLDSARETLLAAPAPPPDEPLAHAFELLGLAPNASPLDVASAYVALCEEIEREMRDAPTEELRRACLEARADVDAAYQRCALSPLRDAADVATGSEAGGHPVRYETQMAAEPFEAPRTPEPGEPALRIEPDDASPERSRRRRRGLRRVALAATLALLLAGAGFAAAWWSGIDLRAALERAVPAAVLSRLVPKGPPPELLEAQQAAESLRRRLSEERVVLQSRIDETDRRVQELQQSLASAASPSERERVASELDRVRTRRELAIQHAELVERHVLTSDAMNVAYAKLERANELMQAGDENKALAAFTDARSRLEAALSKLDVAEEAVDARSEAEAGLEAWRAFAASAHPGTLEPAARATEELSQARELLSEGKFDSAVPELRRAAQHFAAALSQGHKQVSAARAEAGQGAPPGGVAAPGPGLDLAASPHEADREAPVAPSAPGAEKGTPPVSAPPPSLERAAIKLVLVPAGAFLYGCNAEVDSDCTAAESPARRISLAAFRIDRTEVRVDEYRSCVEAGACSEPGDGPECNWTHPERGDHPVNCVDWSQAHGYCAWVGKRLPTEREWEKAARGVDGRVYPWGNGNATCYRAVIAGPGAPGCGLGSTAPVASRAEGRSPFGLFDMAGNVLEWTADQAEDGLRVVRGGSWRGDAAPARASARRKVAATTRDASIGFRCAQGPGMYAVTAP